MTRTISAIVAVLLFVTQPVAGHSSVAIETEGSASQQYAGGNYVSTTTQLVGTSQLVGTTQLVGTSLPIDSAHPVSMQHEQRLTFTLSPDTPLSGSATTDLDTASVIADLACPCCPSMETDGAHCSSSMQRPSGQDEFWVVSTRCLTWNCNQANLDSPSLRVSKLTRGGQTRGSSMDEYLTALDPMKRVVFYVHGNRTPRDQAISGGLTFYHNVKPYLDSKPTRWVIFVWPSAQAGVLMKDAREKAARTDAEGLYLAWLVRHHVQTPAPIAMVGYSFGARVISGSLHAMAGGCLSNRSLPQPHFDNAGISAGFVAPAFDADWMTPRNYHANATRNLRTLTLLYNHRDIALRNHWRLSRERSSEALGFSGPRGFGARADGTPLPVSAINCTAMVRARHAERFYYDRACMAGRHMAKLINQSTAQQRFTLSLKNDDDSSQH